MLGAQNVTLLSVTLTPERARLMAVVFACKRLFTSVVALPFQPSPGGKKTSVLERFIRLDDVSWLGKLYIAAGTGTHNSVLYRCNHICVEMPKVVVGRHRKYVNDSSNNHGDVVCVAISRQKDDLCATRALMQLPRVEMGG